MKILLVQTSFLGDTILSTPVIAGIKRLHPEAELWMLTTPVSAGLVQGDPLLAGVLTFDKRRRDAGLRGLLRKARELKSHQFDRVYALHRSWRTAFLLFLAGIPCRIGFQEARLPFLLHRRSSRKGLEHEVLRNLMVLSGEAGLGSFDPALRLFPPSAEQPQSEIMGSLPSPGSYVCVVPGSVWFTKRWHADNYKELVHSLVESGTPVLVLGDRSEAETAEHVCAGTGARNLCGLTTIPEMMQVVRNAKGLVCNDSMSLHLGSAFKIPTATIFCATSPKFGFGPWLNPRAEVIERTGLPCKPCSRHGGNACPVRTEACMREVKSEEVLQALRRVISIS